MRRCKRPGARSSATSRTTTSGCRTTSRSSSGCWRTPTSRTPLSFLIDVDDGCTWCGSTSPASYFREVLLAGDSRIHLSVTGHTMELYRRLPGGWRPTPRGDLHRPLFLAAPAVAPGNAGRERDAADGAPLPQRPAEGWSIEQRIAEIDRWHEPGMAVALPQRLLDNVLPDRAALDEALTSREREVEALSAHVRGRSSERRRPTQLTPASCRRSPTPSPGGCAAGCCACPGSERLRGL